mmetsp:Transcript_25308/g.49796  ORF Transcript_25308/g.49796 Transcript_25308/m.49796 type:complete len:313 (+) Transcript_25308:19-957(+)
MFGTKVFLLLVLFVEVTAAAGAFATAEKLFDVPILDETDPRLRVIYPKPNGTSSKFPFISYMHGFMGGGIDLLGYTELFHDIASFGFVVAAPLSCNAGCKSQPQERYTCAGLPDVYPSGHGWSSYYTEGLKTIEFARNKSLAGDPIFSTVDWGLGVGLAGHSMGGQATAVGAASACTEKWNILAAVLHHPAPGKVPAGNVGSNISVPLIGFTSSGDNICPPDETEGIMNASQTATKAFRNAEGLSHLEPVLFPPYYNPLLATFTAAWFKVFLNQDRGKFYDMVFGSAPDSLCKSMEMASCYTQPPKNHSIPI